MGYYCSNIILLVYMDYNLQVVKILKSLHCVYTYANKSVLFWFPDFYRPLSIFRFPQFQKHRSKPCAGAGQETVESTQGIAYSSLMNHMVMWCLFFIPLRCLMCLLGLSTIGQDWTKKQTCSCLSGSTKMVDEQARMLNVRQGHWVFLSWTLSQTHEWICMSRDHISFVVRAWCLTDLNSYLPYWQKCQTCSHFNLLQWESEALNGRVL